MEPEIILVFALMLQRTIKFINFTDSSLLAVSFFSKDHLDESLVITNVNCVGRVEKKAGQGRIAEWGRSQDKKKPPAVFNPHNLFQPS